MDADRWLNGQERALAEGTWLDPSRSAILLADWAETWLPTRSDLRPTSRARLESVVRLHVVPAFGDRRLASIGNAEVRAWVGRMVDSGMSAASVRKAVFALRGMLDAAVADRRLSVNPATSVPLPTEKATEQRFLSSEEAFTLAEAVPTEYRALVLLGAFAGLRWGELAGLRRSRVDVLRSRVTVAETATQVSGKVAFGEPKTARSRRVVPVARSVMREVEAHLAEHVDPGPDALLFTAAQGGPLWRMTFWRQVWEPALRRAGLEGLRVHDLRHSFVSIMVAAGANPKEVSTWAGHSSVAFTLDRYGHLYDDHSDDVADRLDLLLSARRGAPAEVRSLG
ncbi:site-specific integrase [uncultured Nocardioides sp.]|uniref:tyrosine-type recombinase/integrase n=1 Tax=uncultured Nocardioides sp. TaxID=198441 RepID=UPI00261ECB37|nr:site-specific integrase [uncultured Nocardioides sp.]